jgi:ankyrin repeat protein
VCISRNLRLAALAICAYKLQEGDGSESSDGFRWDIPFSLVASSFNQPSALHLAAHFGLDEIAKILLGGSHKVDINLKIFSETPLMISSGRGHESFIRLLLEREGIVSDTRDDRGLNALLHAVRGGHTKVVSLLIKKGVDIESSTDNGRSALMGYLV